MRHEKAGVGNRRLSVLALVWWAYLHSNSCPSQQRCQQQQLDHRRKKIGSLRRWSPEEIATSFGILSSKFRHDWLDRWNAWMVGSRRKQEVSYTYKIGPGIRTDVSWKDLGIYIQSQLMDLTVKLYVSNIQESWVSFEKVATHQWRSTEMTTLSTGPSRSGAWDRLHGGTMKVGRYAWKQGKHSTMMKCSQICALTIHGDYLRTFACVVACVMHQS